MWIRMGDGRVVLTHHDAHITRLLADGCMEVSDPTIPLQGESDEIQETYEPLDEQVAATIRVYTGKKRGRKPKVQPGE